MNQETENTTTPTPVAPAPEKAVSAMEILEKMSESKRIIETTTTFAYDTDRKLEALVDLLTECNVITREGFEQRADQKRGLRLRGKDEEIGDKDIVWVNYEAKIEGEETPIKEDGIPVRLSANAFVFGSELIGKKPGEKFTFEKKILDNAHPKWGGKNVTYSIETLKAKAPLNGN